MTKMTKKSTNAHIFKNTDFSCENNDKKLYIFWNLNKIPSQWLIFLSLKINMVAIFWRHNFEILNEMHKKIMKTKFF